MKKILGISLVAIMAVGAANAQIASQGYVDSITGALSGLSEGIDNTNLVAAINDVASDASSGASSVKSVTEGSTNGTIAVNNVDVAVHGLGTAAYTASTAYDASGSASAAQTAAEGYTDTKIGTLPTDPSTEQPYTTVGAAIAAANTAAGNSVQSVALESGTNDGTVKLTVDGVATDNIAVTGLGSAAYTDSTAYIPVSTNSTGTTGTQVLTRTVDSQTGAVTYMWESIERATGEND